MYCYEPKYDQDTCFIQKHERFCILPEHSSPGNISVTYHFREPLFSNYKYVSLVFESRLIFFFNLNALIILPSCPFAV